jgi:hypothetical protein
VSERKQAAHLGEEEIASLSSHPHARKTVTQTKISGKKRRFYFQPVARDYWQLAWLFSLTGPTKYSQITYILIESRNRQQHLSSM